MELDFIYGVLMYIRTGTSIRCAGLGGVIVIVEGW